MLFAFGNVYCISERKAFAWLLRLPDHLDILFYSEFLSFILLLTDSPHLIAAYYSVYLFTNLTPHILGVKATLLVSSQSKRGESLINGNVIMIIVIMNTSNLPNCPFPGNPHNNPNYSIIL